MVTGRVKESCEEIYIYIIERALYTGDTNCKKYGVYVHNHSDTILQSTLSPRFCLIMECYSVNHK